MNNCMYIILLLIENQLQRYSRKRKILKIELASSVERLTHTRTFQNKKISKFPIFRSRG